MSILAVVTAAAGGALVVALLAMLAIRAALMSVGHELTEIMDVESWEPAPSRSTGGPRTLEE